jgi:hypothetical protein
VEQLAAAVVMAFRHMHLLFAEITTRMRNKNVQIQLFHLALEGEMPPMNHAISGVEESMGETRHGAQERMKDVFLLCLGVFVPHYQDALMCTDSRNLTMH